MKIKNKKIFLICVIALCAASYFIFDSFIGNRKSENAVSYSDFCSMVENGEIKNVTVEKDYLSFRTNNSDEKLFTVNPESPLLKEFLLKNNVEVEVQKSSTEIISIILDVIFYGIFFVIFFFVFRKFISPNTFKVVKKTGKKFDDIVGMDSLKKDMKQIMDMMRNPKAYAEKGMRLPKGIILEGDPGNGKTLFAKALAGEAKINFIPTKATDFESMFMAIGPMKVKLLFKKARKAAPCIVFIDEFDGIGTRRNYTGSAIETENTRIVTAMLNELDGFEQSDGVLVVAATNNINALDEALIRPGRFDARVKVLYPDEQARCALVKMYSKEKSFDSSCTENALAKKFSGFSCAKIESVMNRACLIASQENCETVSMKHVDEALKDY